MFSNSIQTDIAPLPAAELLDHLRPVEQYAVTLTRSEERDGITLKRYAISAARFRGADVTLSLGIAIANPRERDLVFCIPGGIGIYTDEALEWLTRTHGANYAGIDWVSRGQSPPHDHVHTIYDPLFMDGDTFRDCFMFHNLSAIWAALNWLFHTGFRPAEALGGSWGGVYSFLMAALDPRVERIYPTFGCGGISFPGVEKRSLWDAALEHIGPARQRTWSAAFDPLLRLQDIGASVYYETATNDKFFSLHAAMTTWHRVPNPLFLSLVHNQDHTMRPFGGQAFEVQRRADKAAIDACRRMDTKRLVWDARSGTVRCDPIDAEERERIRLIWSEQLPSHGNMSRAWSAVRPAGFEGDAAVFRIESTHPEAELLFYANQRLATKEERILNASTPIRAASGGGAISPASRDAARTEPLLDARAAELWTAPVGDRHNAPVEEEQRGWTARFARGKHARFSRFGIRPWLLPAAWRAIEALRM